MRETKIIIAGSGGQGVVAAGNIMARACVIEGKNVTGMVSYGAEMRGGTANATLVISEDEIASPFVERPDIAIILNQPSLERFEDDVPAGGLVLLNTSMLGRSPRRKDLDVIEIAATELAHQLGNIRTANMIVLGAFVKGTGLLEAESIRRGIRDLFSSKHPKMVELNLQAFDSGLENGRRIDAALPKR